MVNPMSNPIQEPSQNATTTAKPSKAKSKPSYQTLNASSQKRTAIEFRGSIALTGVSVVSSKCACFRPFVVNPEATELYIKVNRNCIVSLNSNQRYSADGVQAYFVTIA